jgi:hypothetical protein
MKIFGADIVKKEKGFFGVRKCSNCNELREVTYLELQGVERFFFIPVKKYITKRYLYCTKCKALYEITDEQWTHYLSYLDDRVDKNTTSMIIKDLEKINSTLLNKGTIIDVEDKIYHESLDTICDNLIKKYGHKETIEEIMSVYFIYQHDKQ